MTLSGCLSDLRTQIASSCLMSATDIEWACTMESTSYFVLSFPDRVDACVPCLEAPPVAVHVLFWF